MKENVLNSRNDPWFSPSWLAGTTRLSVIPRQPIAGWRDYVALLASTPIDSRVTIHKHTAAQELETTLRSILPPALHHHPSTLLWIEDMAVICQQFCWVTAQDTTCWWLRSTRVCSKFHIDKTPCRLLVTYAGEGTEWTEDSLAEYSETSAIQRIPPWHIALLRGGKNGLVHRSPPQSLHSYSILLRLDIPTFFRR